MHDTAGDVYGKQASIAFVERLRDELKFESAEELGGELCPVGGQGVD